MSVKKYALVGENRAVEIITKAVNNRPVNIERHADNSLTAIFEHVTAEHVERRIASAHPAIQIIVPDGNSAERSEPEADSVTVRFGFTQYPN